MTPSPLNEMATSRSSQSRLLSKRLVWSCMRIRTWISSLKEAAQHVSLYHTASRWNTTRNSSCLQHLPRLRRQNTSSRRHRQSSNSGRRMWLNFRKACERRRERRGSRAEPALARLKEMQTEPPEIPSRRRPDSARRATSTSPTSASTARLALACAKSSAISWSKTSSPQAAHARHAEISTSTFRSSRRIKYVGRDDADRSTRRLRLCVVTCGEPSWRNESF